MINFQAKFVGRSSVARSQSVEVQESNVQQWETRRSQEPVRLSHSEYSSAVVQG